MRRSLRTAVRTDYLARRRNLRRLKEAREGKTRALPKGPSEEQMRVHWLTHYPFRNWCPQCVAGRAEELAAPQTRRER